MKQAQLKKLAEYHPATKEYNGHKIKEVLLIGDDVEIYYEDTAIVSNYNILIFIDMLEDKMIKELGVMKSEIQFRFHIYHIDYYIFLDSKYCRACGHTREDVWVKQEFFGEGKTKTEAHANAILKYIER